MNQRQRELSQRLCLFEELASGLLIEYAKYAVLFNPEPQVLKLHILSGLEARHIVSRWREPPECEKHRDSGLKGRHSRQCAGPSGL